MSVAASLSKAQRLERASQLEDAAAIYGDILARQPENRRAKQALEALRAKLNAPANPAAPLRQDLAASFTSGRFDAAARQCGTLLKTYPRSHFLWNFLGRCHLRMGNLDMSATCLNKALDIQPGAADTLSSLGDVSQHRGRLDEALALYSTALEADPEHLPALNSMASALSAQERFDDAAALLKRAVALTPDTPSTRLALADALRSLGHTEDAKEEYRRAAELAPDMAAAHFSLGRIFAQEGDAARAAGCFARALAANPDDDRSRAQRLHMLARLNDWAWVTEYDSHRRHLGLRGTPCPPVAMMALEDNPDLLRVRTQAHAAAEFESVEPRLPARAASRPERLKIGYFGAGLRDPAAAHLAGGLLAQHDNSRFSIHAFSYGPAPAETDPAQLQEHTAVFHDVGGLPDAQVIQLAKDEGLDIAVDLQGYAGGTRSRLFAARLAPLHIACPGYPGTMGTAAFDYFIADEVSCPPGSERHFDEYLIRLPGTCQVSGGTRPISPPGFTRADCGLPAEGFVFCCFASSCKITPREFSIWMRLLAGAPDSVLWLPDSGPHSVSNLRRAAAASGIDPGRLVFAPQMPREEHLARLPLADLFLDTFALNARTAAGDALWTGLPVLTLPGRQFAARVGASMVQAAGLSELIATDEADYEAKAASMAATPDACAAFAARLQENRLSSRLFDTRRFTRTLERAFDMAYDRHLQGLPPGHLRLTDQEDALPDG